MKVKRIIECVPNFSEGRDLSVIKSIENSISAISGVKLLNVDPGSSTNRTVITFAGDPDAVIEAAFQAIKTASELIDMSKHKGEHPRMGATDVCPLIPISGISMAETVSYAKKLAERVGNELKIPVYLYEAASSLDYRRNLADIRSGEYEGLAEKMKLEEWAPDFGPKFFQSKSGASVIGARDFLIAYNVNLNTKSVTLANEVAFDIRENGRVIKDPITNKSVKNEKGEIIRSAGKCKSVKAIGWYIDEYQQAQVSMNLTDMNVTSLHTAFEECKKAAESYGLLVTGSELVGLVPKSAMIEAGLYFLNKQKRSLGVSEEELIQIAIQSMGLNSISNFDPNTRIIENMIEEKNNPLVQMSLSTFALETASERPAPGGGSVSAYVASLSASLGTMVANLTAHKKGYEEKFDFFSKYALEGQGLMKNLLTLVDEDTNAFNGIINAFRLPKSSDEEKSIRKKAIRKATEYAIEVPMKTMEQAEACLPLLEQMILHGNPNSISDAGVGALCIKAAVQGAGLNVLINASSLDKVESKEKYILKAKEIERRVILKCDELYQHILAGIK